MHIRITKRNDHAHLFEIVRERGPAERAELETRSYLLHDFLHYAVEEAAGLTSGFYGRLHAGATLESLSHRAKEPPAPAAQGDAALALVEGVVGLLTGFAKGQQDIDQALALYDRAVESGGRERPNWVDAAFLARVRRRVDQLTGHFRALRYGEALELTWPPPMAAG